MNTVRSIAMAVALILSAIVFNCYAAPQQTAKFEYSQSTDKVSISVVIEYPSENDATSVAIRKKLFEAAFGWANTDDSTVVNYDGSFAQFSACVYRLCDMTFTSYANTDWGIDEEYGMDAMESRFHVSKGAEAAKYVVYDVGGYDYIPGALHGMYGEEQLLFRTSDGKHISQVVNRSYERAMQLILKEAFTRYFRYERTDMTFDDLFLENGYIPLPCTEPSFSPSGVVLEYQLYEISAYCFGTQTVTVPYSKIMPYLTPEAKSLL